MSSNHFLPVSFKSFKCLSTFSYSFKNPIGFFYKASSFSLNSGPSFPIMFSPILVIYAVPYYCKSSNLFLNIYSPIFARLLKSPVISICKLSSIYFLYSMKCLWDSIRMFFAFINYSKLYSFEYLSTIAWKVY